MENENHRTECPSGLTSAAGPSPAETLGPLDGPVVQALLQAMGCHALILDPDLRLVAHDPGAAEALGLARGPGGVDILPALVKTHFASRGYRLCGAPIPLGEQGRHLWLFKDVAGLERREEVEMIFLHELLTSLCVRDVPVQPCGPVGPRIRWLWDLALKLYREIVVPRLAETRGREAPAAAADEPAETRCEPVLDQAPQGRESPVVMVVDDSSMVRRLLQAVLAREFRVLAAQGGEEALALAQQERPDVILLDAVMPGMDGFALCAQLKADPRMADIPVLFLTSLQGESDEMRALEAGAIDFIQKPINASTVLARVRNHVELKRSKDKLVELAVQDGLTSLANRRHFDQALAREWHRARREGKPISLILGDIDCFKGYNDAYGHVEGDACLRAVASAFRGVLHRPTDLAARYGGEEFVCLLPETDEVGARALAQAVTSALAVLNLPHGHSEVAPHVTVSLGVATAYPGPGDWPGGLVEEADRRMFEAKRRAKGGRGQGPGIIGG